MTKQIVVTLMALLAYSSCISQRLVLPGDHPDPSAVQIGNTYWATATTSNWFPAFPLLRSDDMVNWNPQGFVFTKKPDWADYYFWAPEITYENGKVWIYYSAHKKNGNLCVGVASADKPEGPYTDLGPLICQEVGSIDGFPMRDENGKLYLVWKEDANSVGKPTPIWASEMNEQRTALIGEKKELFRNDQPWEKNLVEGVSMVKHNGYFYAIYAAAGCCGSGCDYVVGAARSKSLLGPWEKDPRNPAMGNKGDWMCPGHGTALEKDGRYFFLYHAYNKYSHAYTGREGLLREFKFDNNGWVEFVDESNNKAAQKERLVSDNFNAGSLAGSWQWSVFQDVDANVKNGQLLLKALPDESGAYLGQKTFSGDYELTAKVLLGQSTALAGVAALGDDKNTVGFYGNRNSLRIVRLKDGKDSTIKIVSNKNRPVVYMKMEFRRGNIRFFTSSDGKRYEAVHTAPVDGRYLPPWDRAVRAGLISRGNRDKVAVFDDFRIRSLEPQAEALSAR
ncbi:glycoside hydrolase [Segetibacter sp. 3557_3]|uniref:family 43 glycosylhydrolase n=1 Tax=Segetibacter sp. 3557_3 TaxID=2547429 RepID=UPI0010586000|nr:family 43 glycosylhydrolase [Segetibacter sp. 3557_3]TDH19726.1 glycoside hydrolase [Segetibacter sp. 3557_3]